MRVGRATHAIAPRAESGWIPVSQPGIGRQEDEQLFLKEIQRVEQNPTGAPGATIATIPPVTFTPKELSNRVVPLSNGDDFKRYRIEKMTTEAGADVIFTYGQTKPPGSTGCVTGPLIAVRSGCHMYPIESATGGDPVWWNKYHVTKTKVDPKEGDSEEMVTDYEYETPPDWAWTASSVGEGMWNDYRGHTNIKVDDGSGRIVRHRFGTGMYDDRISDTNPNALGTLASPPDEVTVNEPWNVEVDNRYAFSGRSLGTITHLDEPGPDPQDPLIPPTPIGLAVNRYDWLPVSGGFTSDDFASPTRITKTTNWAQMYEDSTVWVARSKVETSFDEFARITHIADFGKTRENGDADGTLHGTFPTDDRTTVVAYESDPNPSSPDPNLPWLLNNIDSSELWQGLPGALNARLDRSAYDYDLLGRMSEQEIQRDATNPDLELTTYTFNGQGQVVTEVKHGDNTDLTDDQTTSYDYDPTFG